MHIRKVVSESSVVERANKLHSAIDDGSLHTFAEKKVEEVECRGGETSASWRALLSLFQANSRDELVTLLGFSKTEIATRVAEAVAKLKKQTEASRIPQEEDVTDIKLHEPVVSFLEPNRDSDSEDVEDDDTLDAAGSGVEGPPSEVSASATSDATSAMRLADSESTTTAPSLFGEDNIGTPQTDAGADFFTTMGLTNHSNDPRIQVPHTNYGIDSSVAATVGSRPSSVASDTLKNNTFRIYPSDESETDRLVTRAVVLGDFESAVSLCLSTERFADAILLAVKGGPELLQKTQKAYFERRTTALPYLRLFQSIVTNDLSDIVQNADLQDWQEIFVVLCSFATPDEFASLAEQLGERLEFQSHLLRASIVDDASTKTLKLRKNATLSYLAAGKLERLVNIWVEELAEDEVHLAEDETWDGTRYATHASALQTFIEKVTVFRTAVKYVDEDLKASKGSDSEAKAYKLSALYDRYFEYADLLASQGLVKEAVCFLKLTPVDYHGIPGSNLDYRLGRERLTVASGTVPAQKPTPVPVVAPTSYGPTKTTTSQGYSYPQYTQSEQPTQPIQNFRPPIPPQPPNHYDPCAHPSVVGQSNARQPSQYQPPAPLQYQPIQQQYAPIQPMQPSLSIGSTPQATNAPLPPPPRGQFSGHSDDTPLPPPPRRWDAGGWNDAPVVQDKRPSSRNVNKLAPIVAPFPNSVGSPGPSPYTSQGQGPSLPPPPRPGSVNSRPPPPQNQVQPPLQPGPGPYGPPPVSHGLPPPQRMISPPQGPILRQASSQFSSPQVAPRQNLGPTPPPPGPYSHSTPPPPGPYGPPPTQQGPPTNLPPPPNRHGPPPQLGPPRFLQPPPQGPPRSGPPPTGTNPLPQSRIQRGPAPPKYREFQFRF